MATDLQAIKTILPENAPYKKVALNTSTAVVVLDKNTKRLAALISLDPEDDGVAVFGSDSSISATTYGIKLLNLDSLTLKDEMYQDVVYGLAITAATDVFVWETLHQ